LNTLHTISSLPDAFLYEMVMTHTQIASLYFLLHFKCHKYIIVQILANIHLRATNYQYDDNFVHLEWIEEDTFIVDWWYNSPSNRSEWKHGIIWSYLSLKCWLLWLTPIICDKSNLAGFFKNGICTNSFWQHIENSTSFVILAFCVLS